MAYIDLSDSAKGKLINEAVLFVEAGAAELRNEIVAQMEPGPIRTGNVYAVPDTNRQYTASAPGEPPAVRTGAYAGRWQSTPATARVNQVMAFATNDAKTENGQHFIGEILEYGTEGIAPRPHIRPALEIVAARYGGRVVEGE